MIDYIFAECPEHGKYMAHNVVCPVCEHNEIFGEGYECYAVRYRPTGRLNDEWATVAVRLPD